TRAASFDHLVGEQLDRVGHLDSERPGRLQVDDELEFGGPDDRQVGGLRVFENSTRVDTDLTPRIQGIGPIAHQQARFDHLTAETTRRYPIARRKRRKLDTPAVEEPIAGNEEGIGAVARESGEGRLDFALCAGLEDLNLQSECAGSVRYATLRALGSRIGRIDQHGNASGLGRRFASNSLVKKLIPVRFPPGRARLATRPSSTGSSPTPKTIGIVVVSALAT